MLFRSRGWGQLSSTNVFAHIFPISIGSTFSNSNEATCACTFSGALPFPDAHAVSNAFSSSDPLTDKESPAATNTPPNYYAHAPTLSPSISTPNSISVPTPICSPHLASLVRPNKCPKSCALASTDFAAFAESDTFPDAKSYRATNSSAISHPNKRSSAHAIKSAKSFAVNRPNFCANSFTLEVPFSSAIDDPKSSADISSDSSSDSCRPPTSGARGLNQALQLLVSALTEEYVCWIPTPTNNFQGAFLSLSLCGANGLIFNT
jgi:hypothetical protein